MALIYRVLGYLRPYRANFVFAVLQVWVLAALEMLKPWPLKIVIDYVLPGNPLPWGPLFHSLPASGLLMAAVLALVTVYLLVGAMSVLNNYTTISIGQNMVNDLRSRLYAHLQRLSLAFHSTAAVGDMIYRVTADAYAIQTLAMNGLFPVLYAAVLLCGMFVVMVRMDWALTLVALAICPLLLLAIVGLSRRIATVAMEARERESSVYQRVQRSMTAIKVVQAFSREADEDRAFSSESRASLRSSLKLYTLQTFYGAAANAVLALGTAAVVWLAARHVWQGTLTVGDMVVFVTYLASLYSPLNSIVQTFGLMQGAKAGLVRVFEVLDSSLQLPDGVGDLPVPAADWGARVAFRDVEFEYTPGRKALRGISFEALPGQTIAVVGATGAGKSTLLSLIPRFYDVTAGAVMVDGIDVRELRMASLRCQVSLVLQPPMVFPISIRDNIAYSVPGASQAEIERAARAAQIHDFIEALPRGYDTVIGESGGDLSEGERQRLTIARALLRNSRILILDEPTSSVDAATEAAIMQGLDVLSAGRTTFVIAHRLSTVRSADVIMVLQEGRIVEQGSFGDLISRGGAFWELYAQQVHLAEEAGAARGGS